MAAHPLAGHLSVDASAKRIRHYRYAEERLMRVLGGWMALTPELPVKLLFGRHVWDCAQHADLWGRRLPELRAPAQQSEPANDRVVRLLDLIESPEGHGQTPERVAGVYRVLKPHLVAVYAHHLESANAVYEPPTRRILERCLQEERRHVAAGSVVFDRVVRDPADRARVVDWERRLVDALAEAGGVTGDVTGPLREPIPAAVDPRTVAPDIVELPPGFDPARLPRDLAAAVDAHRRALAEHDLERAGGQVTADARRAVLAEYAKFPGPATSSAVVAMAKIGEYRVAKLRFEDARGVSVVQIRWKPSDRGWEVIGAELVRSEALA